MATYDTLKPERVKHARAQLERLIKKGAYVKIENVDCKSADINSYFHLIVTYLAVQLGCTVHYAKEDIVKKIICPEIFLEERFMKNGGEAFTHVRSWAKLNTTEANRVVNKLRNYSSIELGIRLPEPPDLAYPQAQREIRAEIEAAKDYLY